MTDFPTLNHSHECTCGAWLCCKQDRPRCIIPEGYVCPNCEYASLALSQRIMARIMERAKQ